jgi:hypothetical protein
MKLNIPLGPENKLVRWANAISAFYGHSVYLVGSQLTAKENPRDVDVLCILPDYEFELRYGSCDEWAKEGASGIYTGIRWKWADDCVKKSLHGMKETQLEIDFKVQPESFQEGYKNMQDYFPPYKLDTRPNNNQTPQP